MRAAIIAFLATLALASPAAADRFALQYKASAIGVFDLGSLSVDADLSTDSYQIRLGIQSSGLMNWFERTNIQGSSTGRIQGAGVFWQTYDLDHHYSRKHRVIALRAGPDGAVQSTITPNFRLWGNPPASEEQRRGARDPLSTVMAMAVDVNLSHRCSGVYPTFDGRFYYVLELSGGEIGNYDDGGYTGPVLKCRLAYIAVAGFERNDRGRRRVPQGEVWFALVPDSAFGPPVLIRTPLSAGAATIRLTSWHRALVSIDPSAAP